MRKRLKAIIGLIAATSSVFAVTGETIAKLQKLEPSPEQKAILDRVKGPLTKCKAEFKEAVKDVFGTVARIGR